MPPNDGPVFIPPPDDAQTVLASAETGEVPSIPTSVSATGAAGQAVPNHADQLPEPASVATIPATITFSDHKPTVLRLDHYEVLTREDGTLWELGRGAMGITYKALDTRLHFHVALKSINTERRTRNLHVRERFLREARAAARLHHPNIATVYHLGETGEGNVFYSMEFIEGQDLDARIRRQGPLPPMLALEIGIEVARALVAASKEGLVHRDLKPANLMLVAGAEEAFNQGAVGKPGSSGPGSGDTSQISGTLVKVIDFGLAKITGGSGPLTGEDDFLGTPQFASPEQFSDSGNPVDARSDIYSLGITLWYALTGKLPFPGRSLTEIRTRQLSQELPVTQLEVARVPAPLVTLLLTMVAANPKDRPQTPQMLTDALWHCRAQILAAASASSILPAAESTVPFVPPPTARKVPSKALLALASALVLMTAAGLSLLRSRSAVAPVPAATPVPVPSPMAPAAVAAPEKSIAVLPFENLSADKDNAYFADGVQDEILTDLAKIADLKVISRTSVMQYKTGTVRNLREIGTQLAVANVVEGSVQRAGNKVRVSAQLIDARTDAHLWAEHFDKPLDDVFAIQSEIAEAIAAQLQARLSPREKSAMDARPTSNLEAHDLYLRALALYADASDQIHASEKLPEAARVLDEALARDPKFLLAWCLLARVHSDLYWQGLDHTPARVQQAEAAVQAAERLAPDAGETHLALADYHYHAFRDYDRAKAELNLSRQTLPNKAEVFEYSGYIERRQGHWSDATRNLERALELDPRNFFTLSQVALSYQCLHRYADARRVYNRALEIVPGDPSTRMQLAQLDLDEHADISPFRVTFSTLVAQNPKVAPDLDDPFYGLCERTPAAAERVLADFPAEGWATNGMLFPRGYWEGVAARWLGDGPRARAAFTSARVDAEKVAAARPDLAIAVSLLGMIDAGLGHKDKAIAEGRRACEMLPMGKDAVDGPAIAANLAQILAWTGEKASAVEQLAAVERTPNLLSYGLLKLHPLWDDLRGESRFESLITGIGPGATANLAAP